MKISKIISVVSDTLGYLIIAVIIGFIVWFISKFGTFENQDNVYKNFAYNEVVLKIPTNDIERIFALKDENGEPTSFIIYLDIFPKSEKVNVSIVDQENSHENFLKCQKTPKYESYCDGRLLFDEITINYGFPVTSSSNQKDIEQFIIKKINSYVTSNSNEEEEKEDNKFKERQENILQQSTEGKNFLESFSWDNLSKLDRAEKITFLNKYLPKGTDIKKVNNVLLYGARMDVKNIEIFNVNKAFLNAVQNVPKDVSTGTKVLKVSYSKKNNSISCALLIPCGYKNIYVYFNLNNQVIAFDAT